jgi:hypothetical protein
MLLANERYGPDHHVYCVGKMVGTGIGGQCQSRPSLKMAKLPSSETIAAGLTVPERILLFCLASDTDWRNAGIAHTTAQRLLVRALIGRDRADALRSNRSGSAVLAALLGH